MDLSLMRCAKISVDSSCSLSLSLSGHLRSADLLKLLLICSWASLIEKRCALLLCWPFPDHVCNSFSSKMLELFFVFPLV